MGWTSTRPRTPTWWRGATCARRYPAFAARHSIAVRQRHHLPHAYLVVSPGNSHRRTRRINHRAWPGAHWQALLATLPPDLPVVLLGARGDEPLPATADAGARQVLDLVGQTSVAEMVTIIAHAKALVVTDTGTAHVAAAVNTPVVCLIGPTNPAVTGPYATPHNVVHTLSVGVPCSPCHGTDVMRRCTANRCMQQITPKRVRDTLLEAGIVSP